LGKKIIYSKLGWKDEIKKNKTSTKKNEQKIEIKRKRIEIEIPITKRVKL
jgi:hypothetical protein